MESTYLGSVSRCRIIFKKGVLMGGEGNIEDRDSPHLVAWHRTTSVNWLASPLASILNPATS
jgi:hypothetical protein